MGIQTINYSYIPFSKQGLRAGLFDLGGMCNFSLHSELPLCLKLKEGFLKVGEARVVEVTHALLNNAVHTYGRFIPTKASSKITDEDKTVSKTELILPSPIEYNPDLALRSIKEYEERRRTLEECLPEMLIEGETYSFLKSGQRNYWLQGEVPLLETKGNQQLSRPLASIVIQDATHFLKGKEVYTRGTYRVERILDINSPEVYFEGMNVNPNFRK